MGKKEEIETPFEPQSDEEMASLLGINTNQANPQPESPAELPSTPKAVQSPSHTVIAEDNLSMDKQVLRWRLKEALSENLANEKLHTLLSDLWFTLTDPTIPKEVTIQPQKIKPKKEKKPINKKAFIISGSVVGTFLAVLAVVTIVLHPF